MEKSLDRRAPAIDANLSRSKPAAGFSPKPQPSQRVPAPSKQQEARQQPAEPAGGGRSATDSSVLKLSGGGGGGDGAETKTGSQAHPQGPARCPNILIKGNISARGDKIYHLPGSRSYVATQIDTRQGERYFCSEAEAQAAGWRAAK